MLEFSKEEEIKCLHCKDWFGSKWHHLFICITIYKGDLVFKRRKIKWNYQKRTIKIILKLYIWCTAVIKLSHFFCIFTEHINMELSKALFAKSHGILICGTLWHNCLLFFFLCCKNLNSCVYFHLGSIWSQKYYHSATVANIKRNKLEILIIWSKQ